MIVGITGKIASGKSHYSRKLADIFVFEYIDCDEIIKNLIIWKKWYNYSSREEYVKDFFDNEDFRSKINQDCKKYLFKNVLAKYYFNDDIYGSVFIESASLFSSGLNNFCDKIIMIECLDCNRFKRMKERNYTDDFILKIEKIQEDEFKNKEVDMIIKNYE